MFIAKKKSNRLVLRSCGLESRMLLQASTDEGERSGNSTLLESITEYGQHVWEQHIWDTIDEIRAHYRDHLTTAMLVADMVAWGFPQYKVVTLTASALSKLFFLDMAGNAVQLGNAAWNAKYIDYNQVQSCDYLRETPTYGTRNGTIVDAVAAGLTAGLPLALYYNSAGLLGSKFPGLNQFAVSAGLTYVGVTLYSNGENILTGEATVAQTMTAAGDLLIGAGTAMTGNVHFMSASFMTKAVGAATDLASKQLAADQKGLDAVVLKWSTAMERHNQRMPAVLAGLQAQVTAYTEEMRGFMNGEVNKATAATLEQARGNINQRLIGAQKQQEQNINLWAEGVNHYVEKATERARTEHALFEAQQDYIQALTEVVKAADKELTAFYGQEEATSQLSSKKADADTANEKIQTLKPFVAVSPMPEALNIGAAGDVFQKIAPLRLVKDFVVKPEDLSITSDKPEANNVVVAGWPQAPVLGKKHSPVPNGFAQPALNNDDPAAQLKFMGLVGDGAAPAEQEAETLKFVGDQLSQTEDPCSPKNKQVAENAIHDADAEQIKLKQEQGKTRVHQGVALKLLGRAIAHFGSPEWYGFNVKLNQIPWIKLKQLMGLGEL